jgi:hypothetical protein
LRYGGRAWQDFSYHDRKGAIMFDQVYQNMHKAVEANLQMQQEMFKKWAAMWPGIPGTPADKVQEFQRKWADFVAETVKRQKEFMEAQFKAGVENVERAFRVGEAKTPEELKAKTLELWKKCFESLRVAYEAQIKDSQALLEKWIELTTKVAA